VPLSSLGVEDAWPGEMWNWLGVLDGFVPVALVSVSLAPEQPASSTLRTKIAMILRILGTPFGWV
jgi:hypothetical protein